MLVGVDDAVVAPTLRNADTHDLLRKPAAGHRGLGTLLDPQGKLVLVVTLDTELVRDVFRRLGHGLDAVLLLDLPVDEAPAEP